MATKRDAATAHSALFMVLPREVRDTILTAAFGGRKLHIQQYGPTAPQAKPQGSRSGWARGGARQWLGGLFATSKSKGKSGPERRWYACVCDSHRRDLGLELRESPSADICLMDIKDSQWKGSHPLEVPAELAIGVMGWLLTCRQAYNEGIEVLYASNTFHVRSDYRCAFRGFIPQIPEAGLSYITSMELVVEPRYVAPETDVSPNQAAMLEDTLSRITDLMPRLQKLYLGFCPDTCLLKDCKSGHKLTYECSRYQVGLLETTVRNLHRAGRSCELEMGLPWTVYNVYQDEAQKVPFGRQVKVGTPHRRPGASSTASWFPRFRIFRYVDDHPLDLDAGDGVSMGPDVGFWISMCSYDLDSRIAHCFGAG